MNKKLLTAKILEINCIKEDTVLPLQKATVIWDGIVGDEHTSRTSIARTQDASDNLVTKGTEILNLRQLTILSIEDLDQTANLLGIKEVTSKDVHANIVLEGIEKFSLLPIGTRMIFPEAASLFITGENNPCIVTGNRVQSSNPDIKNLNFNYVKAAIHKRGVLAMVIRPGFIRVGDEVKIKLP